MGHPGDLEPVTRPGGFRSRPPHLLKSRIYEQRLEWLRSDAAARFNTLLRDSRHPLLGVIALRERTVPELIVELEVLRGQLPRMMRLREAMAIARGRSFQIDLTPGHGLLL